MTDRPLRTPTTKPRGGEPAVDPDSGSDAVVGDAYRTSARQQRRLYIAVGSLGTIALTLDRCATQSLDRLLEWAEASDFVGLG
jgi:hypothetical protein